MPSARGIVIEIIGDARSYLHTVNSTLASNTKLDASFKEVGINAQLSADAQLKAAAKSSAALKANAVALRAGISKLPVADQAAATVAADAALAKYNRSIGLTATSTAGFGRANRTAERDLNKAVRGALAGSGVFGKLGRSLAFASSGFLGVAIGVGLISKSITSAEALAKAQDSLSVAIEHTGGSAKKLLPLYTATAKAAAQFGIDQADATTGLARATVLTGDAASAQRAYKEALVISKATGKDFNAVLTATSKGQIGVTTSLRRYGILVSATSSGQQQFNQVLGRFGGQAAANTTSLEKLHAAFQNSLETIGQQLLPTINRLADAFANWLTKMNESGKLQRDVAKGMSLIHDVTSPLITDMGLLAKAIGLANESLGHLGHGLQSLGGLKLPAFLGGSSVIPGGSHGGFTKFTDELGKEAARVLVAGPAGIAFAFRKALQQTPGVAIPAGGPRVPGPGRLPFEAPSGQATQTGGPFGTAKPLSQFFKQFQLNFQQQLAQVQASLTRSTTDDVAAARAVVADIKKKIDSGQLHGAALVQALGLEASALSTIWSAEDAAAQKRAAAAQAAKAKIQAQIENSINPIDLQLAVARDEATGKSTLKDLERQRAAARRALASGNLDKQQQLEALNQITSLNQQIADARKQTTKSFTQSLKLQIALARAQAFGTDTTPILQRMKAALLRALHSGKFHGQALIDLLNQISDINSQLNSATSSSLNFFKQLNTRALTSGLGLTPAQRAALRARLSQVGPNGTVPGSGVGAAGFVIGADDRPIILHHTTKLDGRPIEKSTTRLQQKRRRRSSSQRRGPNAGG